MTDLLFVYGSLLSTAGHPNGQRLAREARLVGAATTPGRLYAISWYPGLLAPAEPGDVVHGEVWRLDDPASSLVWLDVYEGIDPSSTGDDDYERALETCVLASGEALQAWLYRYRRPVQEATRVRSGRWTDIVDLRRPREPTG